MRYVLITGAYGGMGASAVRHFASCGFCVIALDKQIGEAAENVIPLQADVTDEQSVKAAFERVRELTDELYAIIHFAGIYMLDSLVEMASERFDLAFRVNLRGVFLVNKIFLPLIKREGRILITTSELAPLAPLPFTGIYAITKGALDDYAYSLRMELQLIGIQVSVLRAGAVDTGMLTASTDALDRFCESTSLYSCNAERFKRIVDGVEARRVSPDRIAKLAMHIVTRKKQRFAYSLNRNPLLLMLNVLPKRTQLRVIKKVLKRK